MNERNYVIDVDYSEKVGPVKRMNAVNNGPLMVGKEQKRSNYDTFKAAKFPYVRNHDASICYNFGGEHTVDVHAIFPDFDKDVNDPASYDFFYTDKYLAHILSTGSKIVYRLGTKIEHGEKRYATIPPKDFNKWAEICEHIVMHYLDGWADGFHWDIEYWEIWNEPDGNPNWTGTPEQYYDLYRITATRLKERFPNIKIGTAFAYPIGTAFVHRAAGDFKIGFFEMLKKENGRVPLDFHGFHGYIFYPEAISRLANAEYELLKEYGYENIELFISEYNYAVENGGMHEKFVESVKGIIGIEGATFTASAMCEGQNSPLDMLMYYDAQPSCFNGIFDFYTLEVLKGYYPFVMLAHLRDLGMQVKSTIEGNDKTKPISTIFATGDDGEAAMISYFAGEVLVDANVKIKISNSKNTRFSLYMLDREHNMEKTAELDFVNGEVEIVMPPMSVAFLKAE